MNIKMSSIFPELRSKELAFNQIILLIFERNISNIEETLSKFSKLIGNYSKELNKTLKVYAKNKDWKTNNIQKINAKAEIKYAYDLLEISIAILKNIEKRKVLDENILSKLEIFENFINSKYKIIKSTYFIAAKKELDSFYNHGIRQKIEEDLIKKLEKKIDYSASKK